MTCLKKNESIFFIKLQKLFKKLDNPKNFYMSDIDTIQFIKKFVKKF